MILELSVDRITLAVVSRKLPITGEDHDRLCCIDSDDEFGRNSFRNDRVANRADEQPPWPHHLFPSRN